MKQYLDALTTVINGEERSDRTGTGTRSIFGYQMRFNLQDGFPLLTTKKLHLKSIIHELLWFLRGDTNVKYLQENGVRIWNEWCGPNGELGPVYGSQWREWEGGRFYPEDDFYGAIWIDQIEDVIESINNNPYSRRHIVSTWNVAAIDDMALPPCHILFQFYVHTDGRLSCHMYQRSADIFLGVPFNIASYALLTMMVAQVCDLKLGELIISFGDLHLYNNHFKQAIEQLQRDPRPLPKMILDPSIKDIDDFEYRHFTLQDYDPYPTIKGDISV